MPAAAAGAGAGGGGGGGGVVADASVASGLCFGLLA